MQEPRTRLQKRDARVAELEEELDRERAAKQRRLKQITETRQNVLRHAAERDALEEAIKALERLHDEQHETFFQVFVEDLNRRLDTFVVSPTMLIADLMHTIEEQLDVPYHTLRLVKAGVLLQPWEVIGEHLSDNDTVTLVTHLRGS